MGHNTAMLILTLLIPCFFAVAMVFNGFASVEDNGELTIFYL
jgi:hypothetical protein